MLLKVFNLQLEGWLKGLTLLACRKRLGQQPNFKLISHSTPLIIMGQTPWLICLGYPNLPAPIFDNLELPKFGCCGAMDSNKRSLP